MKEPIVARCYDCGLDYTSNKWIETIIPDKIWVQISPTGDIGGILCISCMAARLKDLGFDNVPVWICGTEPFKIMGDKPEKDLDIVRNYSKKK